MTGTERCVTHHPPRPGRPWRLAEPGLRVCDSCFARMRRWLTGRPEPVFEGSDVTCPVSIPGLFAALDLRPVVGDSGRRGPGFGSRSPAVDDVIVMRDPRSKSCEVACDLALYLSDGSGDAVERVDVWLAGDGRVHTEQETPPVSVAHVLGSAAQLIAEERNLTGRLPMEVGDLAEFLDLHLEWVAKQDRIIDLHDSLRDLQAQLRAAHGDRRPLVGRCIEQLETGECGAPIFMPPGGMPRAPDEPIRSLPDLACSSCGSLYSGQRMILAKLANLIADARTA